MVILSGVPVAGAAASVRVPMGDAAIASSKMTMIGTLMAVSSSSIKMFSDRFPVGAVHEKDASHRAPVVHRRRRTDRAVAGVRFHDARGNGLQRPLRGGQGALLIARGGEVS